MNEPVLELRDVCVRYGAVDALRGVSLAIPAGGLVALLGANGAGKTSLLRTVSGLVPVASGEIRILGEGQKGLRSCEIVRRGVAHCPEGRCIFPDMSVRDNLLLGAYVLGGDKKRAENLERVLQHFPVLRERARQKGGTLSGGEQQMLAVGRALMSSPRLLMLDEPSLGLAPLIIEQIFEILTAINREEGVTIFLVEQNANEALLHATYGYVLENGEIALSGTADDLRQNPRVAEAYLGV